MNISQLLELQKKKAQLEKKKGFLLKKALHKKKLEQINVDQSSVKKGYIEKTKIIKKKQYQTFHQKARTHIPIQIQQNASVSSYLINNSNFEKIYQRTKKLINFYSSKESTQNLKNSLAALRSFADQKFEKIVHLKLIFQKQIDCSTVIRPFQLDLPYKNESLKSVKTPIPKAIILVNNAKTVSANENFKNLVNYSISIKQYGQFIKDWKNDKDFKKQVSNNRILILCDWQIFKNTNKFIQNLLGKNFTVFPFDVKKVPYFVQEKHEGISYEDYLNLMIQNQYALVKSGSQHTIHLKLNTKLFSAAQLEDNVKQATIQTVAKLIQRNKNKFGNSLLKVQAKTNTSINFCLYKKNS